MRFLALTAAGLAALLLTSCYSVPARVDPLSESTRLDAPTRKLSVVLVNTENARNARKYLLGMPYTGGASDTLFENISAVFYRNFKTVAKADSLEEAKTSGADVVALIDVYAHIFYGVMNAQNHLDLGAILLAPDGSQIDDIKSSSDVNGFSHFMATESIRDLVTKSPAAFEQALQASPKLRAFAASARPAAAAVAAAPVQAPAVAIQSDVDLPAYKLKEKADDFAMVVGIESYSGELPPARFAERDAQTVKDHLRAQGVPERNIKLLLGSRASKANLEAYLEDWLPKNVKPRGRVFFYFSGHGAPDAGSGQAFLVPWDGNPSFLDRTGYPLKKLYADLAAIHARQVVVALDSCFSGAGGRSVLAENARPLVTKLETAPAPDSKLVLFAASAPQEITGALSEQGHGVFTYYFLKGLAGAAKDDSGAVTARGLYDYLRPKVQDEASRQNREQNPVLSGPDVELARF